MGNPASFCQRCGAELVDAATYCTACGAAVTVRSTRGKYIWLCVVATIFTFFLATAVFNFTGMLLASGLEGAAKVGTPNLFVIILLGVVGDRLWKSILTLEPESNPLFKRKHRKFTAMAGGLVGAIFVVSLLGGIVVAGPARAKQAAEKADIQSQAATLAAQKEKNAEFRKRLAALRSVRPSTYEAYCKQCVALETLLNDDQPNIERNSLLIARYLATVNKYPDLRTTTLWVQAQLLKDIDDEDGQILTALREEIAKAKELKALPNWKRDAYYHREILPVLAKEQRIAEEEKLLLIRLQQNGVAVPSDISPSIKH